MTDGNLKGTARPDALAALDRLDKSIGDGLGSAEEERAERDLAFVRDALAAKDAEIEGLRARVRELEDAAEESKWPEG